MNHNENGMISMPNMDTGPIGSRRFSRNGTVFVAWRDGGSEMVLIPRTFATLEEAREAAGPLGVGGCVTWRRWRELRGEGR